MRSNICCRPSNPDQMILIYAFQNLALDKMSQKEILEKGRTDIRPEFGDTWAQKMLFDFTKVQKIVFGFTRGIGKISACISLLPVLIKGLSRWYNIWKHMPWKVFFYEIKMILASMSRWSLCKYLGGTFVIYMFFMVTIEIIPLSIESWIYKGKIKGKSLLPDLAKHNPWWDCKAGQDFYAKRSHNAFMTGMATRYVAEECRRHLDSMSDAEYRKRDVMHIWDKWFTDIVDELESQEDKKIDLADRTLCSICYNITEYAGILLEKTLNEEW